MKFVRINMTTKIVTTEWATRGKSIMLAELDFNRRAGFTDKAGKLPNMFHNEQLSAQFNIVPYPKEDLHGTFKHI